MVQLQPRNPKPRQPSFTPGERNLSQKINVDNFRATRCVWNSSLVTFPLVGYSCSFCLQRRSDILLLDARSMVTETRLHGGRNF